MKNKSVFIASRIRVKNFINKLDMTIKILRERVNNHLKTSLQTDILVISSIMIHTGFVFQLYDSTCVTHS